MSITKRLSLSRMANWGLVALLVFSLYMANAASNAREYQARAQNCKESVALESSAENPQQQTTISKAIPLICLGAAIKLDELNLIERWLVPPDAIGISVLGNDDPSLSPEEMEEILVNYYLLRNHLREKHDDRRPLKNTSGAASFFAKLKGPTLVKVGPWTNLAY